MSTSFNSLNEFLVLQQPNIIWVYLKLNQQNVVKHYQKVMQRVVPARFDITESQKKTFFKLNFILQGEGFDVVKSGDARIALIGFPSVGKSTLLSTVTRTESSVASYEFTTLTCIPGVIEVMI